ncbi:MAG: dockerin type I repeat-containing protein, partial [Phycisphaerales bacterium]
SVRSFSVPVDGPVSLTNVGFKDVAYHSGEPYSGTDWTFSSGGGVASWATQTFAQNQNANALRWATAYSFRFDANQPPSIGTITLGMFKTGASVAVNNVQVPAVPPPPTPGPFGLTSPANGAVVGNLTPTLSWADSVNVRTYEVKVATNAGLTSLVASEAGLEVTSWQVPAATLLYNTIYHWGVRASNNDGSTNSTPTSQSFRTPPSPCAGDADGNGTTNTIDLTLLLGTFGTNVTAGFGADFDNDGSVTTSDLTILLGGFGCPG